MPRPHKGRSDTKSLRNLKIAKWCVRAAVYPGVSLLIPIDIFFLHFPLLASIVSHLGGYVVATLGIELGYAWGERLSKQNEFPGLLTEDIGSPTNLREACMTAVRSFAELLGADAVTLVVFHRGSDSPEVLVSHGLPPRAPKFSDERAASLGQYHQSMESRNILVQRLDSSHPLAEAFGPGRCRVWVPVIALDKVMGMLLIYGQHRRYELRDRTLLDALSRTLGLLLDNVRLYGHEYQTMLHILTGALDQRDGVTEGHSRRVADLSLIVARELGINGEELLDIERAGILHDIGKLAVPDAILSKPGPLTSEEWVEMRRHPDVGYRLLRDVPFLGHAAEIVYTHHERFDGLGYPRGLKGDEIPIGARIFAVVDAYDAMTSDRPYRLARSHQEALDEIRQQVGTQFDPVVVAPFFAAVRKGLIGPNMQAREHKPVFEMAGGDGDGLTPSPEKSHAQTS
jgi:putative nucleotidyltransferase with HDIG domain